ncbi:MAG: cytochrome b N-terminal domain-containing protein [Planctomycetes bacterium]|nr:cytochrome b N-terminal domain-containing protein [Planctomycetota bacterium]
MKITQRHPKVKSIWVDARPSMSSLEVPALFIPVLMIHLWLVQKHGNALPPSEEKKPKEERRSIPFFPNFMMKDLAIWLICMNLLTFLAAVFPWELGQPADPLAAAPEGIHPEWFFMSSFQALKVIGHIVPGATGEYLGMGLFTIVLVMWALIPLYDKDGKNARRARLATWFGIAFLLANIVLTLWGYAAL